MSYFANECFVCKSRDTLKICGRCNMISYCGSLHQKEDWPNHKEFCNALSFLLEEMGVSHIYENQRDSDSNTWCEERERITALVQSKLDRPLHFREEQMLLMPRSCFVCHDTQQEFLTTCYNCFCVNFCEKHPSSPQHDTDCESLKMFYHLDDKIQNPNLLRCVLSLVQKIVTDDSFDAYSQIPVSMDEYLNRLITSGDVSLLQACASNMLSMPLTLFNAVIKLNLQSSSELVFHVRCELTDTAVWELLLHFLPNLNFLKIIFIDQQESLKVKMKLCKDCRAKNKNLILQMKDLSYKNFIEDEVYQKPDILAYFYAEVSKKAEELEWQNLLECLYRIGCSFLLTCVTESKAKAVAESLRTTFWTNSICYEGVNNFGALEPLREWTDGGIGKINQYIIVTDGQHDCHCKAKRYTNESPLLLKKEAGQFWDSQYFFYPHICRICRIPSTVITCKFCNTVFYCSEAHRRLDWYYHKDLCKMIQVVTMESGRKNIFDGELDLINSDKVNSEVWLQARLNILSKIESQFDRELLVYEEQMFLFPRTCFVCQESDLNKLFSCKCGIILCKVHKDFRGHKSICQDLYLNFLLTESKDIVDSLPEFEFASELKQNLPDSIQEFLESWIIFDNEMEVSNIKKIVIAELFTKPLSLLGAMEKLSVTKSKSLVIHMVGSHNTKTVEEEFWDVFFVWLQELKNLNITLFGFETKPLNFTRDFSMGSEISTITVKSFPLTFEQFILSKYFTKPDIIVGYDLDIHECNLETCSFNKDILTIKKINVPIVMTSGTKERARKDHKRLQEILEAPILPDFAYINPFASLEPVRDLETQGLRYLNKCVMIYSKWGVANDDKVDIFAEQVESAQNCELEKKLEELFSKSKPQLAENLDSPCEEPRNFAEVSKKLEESKNEFKSNEEELKASNIFSAHSELKNLLRNVGYDSKESLTKSNIKKKSLEEPDLECMIKTDWKKIVGTTTANGGKASKDRNLEDKCREVFLGLIDGDKTDLEENKNGHPGTEEIQDVEILETIEHYESVKDELGNKKFDERSARMKKLGVSKFFESKTQNEHLEEKLCTTKLPQEVEVEKNCQNTKMEENFKTERKTDFTVENSSVKSFPANGLLDMLNKFKTMKKETINTIGNDNDNKIEENKNLGELQESKSENFVSSIIKKPEEKLSDPFENYKENLKTKSKQLNYFRMEPNISSTSQNSENTVPSKVANKKVENIKSSSGDSLNFLNDNSELKNEMKNLIQEFKSNFNILETPKHRNLKIEEDDKLSNLEAKKSLIVEITDSPNFKIDRNLKTNNCEILEAAEQQNLKRKEENALQFVYKEKEIKQLTKTPNKKIEILESTSENSSFNMFNANSELKNVLENLKCDKIVDDKCKKYHILKTLEERNLKIEESDKSSNPESKKGEILEIIDGPNLRTDWVQEIKNLRSTEILEAVEQKKFVIFGEKSREPETEKNELLKVVKQRYFKHKENEQISNPEREKCQILEIIDDHNLRTDSVEKLTDNKTQKYQILETPEHRNLKIEENNKISNLETKKRLIVEITDSQNLKIDRNLEINRCEILRAAEQRNLKTEDKNAVQFVYNEKEINQFKKVPNKKIEILESSSENSSFNMSNANSELKNVLKNLKYDSNPSCKILEDKTKKYQILKTLKERNLKIRENEKSSIPESRTNPILEIIDRPNLRIDRNQEIKDPETKSTEILEAVNQHNFKTYYEEIKDSETKRDQVLKVIKQRYFKLKENEEISNPKCKKSQILEIIDQQNLKTDSVEEITHHLTKKNQILNGMEHQSLKLEGGEKITNPVPKKYRILKSVRELNLRTEEDEKIMNLDTIQNQILEKIEPQDLNIEMNKEITELGTKRKQILETVEQENLKTEKLEEITDPKINDHEILEVAEKQNLKVEGNDKIADPETKSYQNLEALEQNLRIQEDLTNSETKECQILEKLGQQNLEIEENEKNLNPEAKTNQSLETNQQNSKVDMDQESRDPETNKNEILEASEQQNLETDRKKLDLETIDHKNLEELEEQNLGTQDNENFTNFETEECQIKQKEKIIESETENCRILETFEQQNLRKENDEIITDPENEENQIFGSSEKKNFEGVIISSDEEDVFENFEPGWEEEIVLKTNNILGSFNLGIVEISRTEDKSADFPIVNSVETSNCDKASELGKETISNAGTAMEEIDDFENELNTLNKVGGELEFSRLDKNLGGKLLITPSGSTEQLEKALEDVEGKRLQNVDFIAENVSIEETLKIESEIPNVIEKELSDIEHLNLDEKSKSQSNLTDGDSEILIEAEDLKCKEISESENILATEAKKSESESIGVNVEKESISELEEVDSLTEKKSMTQPKDSATDLDLFREILLLKEEIKRLRENEEVMKSENLRLKEEVGRQRDQ